MKIDFIIPYVNCDDKEWLSEFQKYGGKLDNSFAGVLSEENLKTTLDYLQNKFPNTSKYELNISNNV